MESTRQLIGLIVQGSLALTILAFAMESRWSDVIAPLRTPGQLLKAVLAVNIIVPAVALLIVLTMPLAHPVAIGLILMAVSPLAPLVPGNALKAGGQRSYVVGLYTLLTALAIVIVPVTVLILNGVFGSHASVSIGAVAKVAILSGLLPIAIGLTIAETIPVFARRAAPVFRLFANMILVIFVLLVLWFAGGELLRMVGNGTILAFGATVAAAIAAGHLLGGPEEGNRGALAMAAAIRHPGLASVIGQASGADRHAIAATLLFLLNGVVITSIYKLWFSRRRKHRDEPAHP